MDFALLYCSLVHEMEKVYKKEKKKRKKKESLANVAVHMAWHPARLSHRGWFPGPLLLIDSLHECRCG